MIALDEMTKFGKPGGLSHMSYERLLPQLAVDVSGQNTRTLQIGGYLTSSS